MKLYDVTDEIAVDPSDPCIAYRVSGQFKRMKLTADAFDKIRNARED